MLAPAKINLRLEVIGSLPNGYHLLRMFNLTVSIYDEIELEFTKRGLKIEIDDPGIPADRTNTVFRAVSYFQMKFGRRFGARIKIRKRIPTGAGLAGGSSDAAAVIRALVQKFDMRLSELDLEELAYQVGADVPYLLFGGPAWVEGIGEKLEMVSDFPELFFLLVKPPFAISTRDVFQAYQPASDLTILPKAVILNAVKTGAWETFCVNHLEKLVLARQPGMERLKLELLRQGALSSVMSGSGSTLVGIFSTLEQAEMAGKEMLNFQPELWVQVVKQVSRERLESEEV